MIHIKHLAQTEFRMSEASQTSHFEMSNGLPGDFSSFTQFLPENFRLTKRTNHE